MLSIVTFKFKVQNNVTHNVTFRAHTGLQQGYTALVSNF